MSKIFLSVRESNCLSFALIYSERRYLFHQKQTEKKTFVFYRKLKCTYRHRGHTTSTALHLHTRKVASSRPVYYSILNSSLGTNVFFSDCFWRNKNLLSLLINANDNRLDSLFLVLTLLFWLIVDPVTPLSKSNKN